MSTIEHMRTHWLSYFGALCLVLGLLLAFTDTHVDWNQSKREAQYLLRKCEGRVAFEHVQTDGHEEVHIYCTTRPIEVKKEKMGATL